MLQNTPHHSCACQYYRSSTGSKHNAETVTSLDEKIKRAKDCVRALNCRRNVLLPIARIPTEIICRIFDIHRNGYPPTKSMLKMLDITQVCSTWRSVTRSCLSLWTDIHVHLPMLAKEGMRLAKPLPLSLWYEETREINHLSMVKQVCKLLPRCRSISLSMCATCWRSASTKLASTPAPYLRGFFLRYQQGSS
jgi:hypothetical protein